MASCERMVPGDLEQASGLVAEYLDDLATFRESGAARPELVFVARESDAVIGICYGLPDDAGGMVLQGIAVESPAAGRGVGSHLLAAWEAAASTAGCTAASVGSADGYVEHFYEKNGYRAVQYLVTLPDERPVADGHGHDVIEIRQHGGRTLVNVASDRGSDQQAKAAILAALGGASINVIYAKALPD